MEQAILNYHYVSKDDSILVPYYRKISNFFINFIPLTISPNVVTLLGLSGILLSTLVTLFLKDYLGIFLTCLTCSLLLFYYQIMDTLDGMQGRRVNMYYNPTTEIFDHGCDSVTTCCVLYNLLYLSNALNNHFILSLCFALCIMINFYLPTWQHANTKVMHFRGGVLNPTESIFAIKLTFIFVGFFSQLFSSIYVISMVLTFMISLTLYHTYVTVRDTFDNTKKDFLSTLVSFLPLLMSCSNYAYLAYYYPNDIYYLNITVPILTAILNLIWYEISDTNYDILTVILSFVLNSCHFYLGIFMTIGLYLYLFKKYVRIMCDVLGMKHFYSIP